MNPMVFSAATYESLTYELPALRARVWQAWLNHAPGTTRQVAATAGIDLLSFRPRTTELYADGLLRLADHQPLKGEGIYQPRTAEEWQAWRAALPAPDDFAVHNDW